jgi:hypothetical protein
LRLCTPSEVERWLSSMFPAGGEPSPFHVNLPLISVVADNIALEATPNSLGSCLASASGGG